MLGKIDRAFAGAGLSAVALKGPLLAERLYARPAARPSSDVDLLVDEAALDDAVRVLASVGYAWTDSDEERRYRREHHHLHLSRARSLPLELHFHAYRGFGAVLPSEPLLARRVAVPGLSALAVLEPPDELVYLAAHAAAHRFVRIGWLWDIRLLVERMTEDEIARAVRRARSWGYARALACAGDLVARFVTGRPLGALGALGAVRGGAVRATVAEPRPALARMATRFAYTALLCDSPGRAARYAAGAVHGRVRGMLSP